MGKVILHHKQLEVRSHRRHVEHLPRGLGEAGGRASVAPRSVHFLPASLLGARGLQGSLGKKVGGRELTAEMEFERVALGCRQSLGITRKWAPASELGERKGDESPSSRAPCPRSPAFPRIALAALRGRQGLAPGVAGQTPLPARGLRREARLAARGALAACRERGRGTREPEALGQLRVPTPCHHRHDTAVSCAAGEESFPRYSQPPSPSADGAKRPPPPIFPWGKGPSPPGREAKRSLRQGLGGDGREQVGRERRARAF